MGTLDTTDVADRTQILNATEKPFIFSRLFTKRQTLRFIFSSLPNGICIYRVLRTRLSVACINLIIRRYGWLPSWINFEWFCNNRQRTHACTSSISKMVDRMHTMKKYGKNWCRAIVVIANFYAKLGRRVKKMCKSIVWNLKWTWRRRWRWHRQEEVKRGEVLINNLNWTCSTHTEHRYTHTHTYTTHIHSEHLHTDTNWHNTFIRYDVETTALEFVLRERDKLKFTTKSKLM